MTKTLRRIATTLTVLAVLGVATATPAIASDRETAARSAYLATHPGGTPINNNEISYGDGTLIVTVTRPAGTLAAPDCPSGWYCFYDGINYTYPRGKLSSCGWQDLNSWGWANRIESAHYNLVTGSANFINEAGSTDQVLFNISTTSRTRANATPNNNKADYVYRYC